MNSYWTELTKNRALSRRRALAVGAGGLTSVALIACGGGSNGGGSSASGASSKNSVTQNGPAVGSAQPGVYSYAPQGAVKGGNLATTGAVIPNWNPISNYTTATSAAGANVYDRLLSSELGPERYTLEAAGTLEASDPLKIVIKLKPNMVFQDIAPVSGRPVTAQDVVATQNYIAKAPNSYDKSFQVNFVDSFETPDANTIVIKMKKPDGYLFGSNHLGNGTSQPIIPAETLDKLDTEKWIGSGPYQILPESELGKRYAYKRFEKFRNAQNVFIDTREAIVITDLAATEAALRSDQIHVGSPTYPTADRIAKETAGKFTLSQQNGIIYYSIYMNMEANQPWQKDVRVRQAMYRFTDRQQINDFATGGQSALIVGTLPKALSEYQVDPKDSDPYYKVDLKESKQLLDAAGFDYNQEYELIPFGGTPGSLNEQTAIVWQNQAKAVGFKMRINSSLPTSELLSKVIAQAKFSLFTSNSPGGNDPAYVLRLYHSDALSQFNHFGLHDPEIDALIEKAESTFDHQENIKIVKQVQVEILKKYGSVIGVFAPPYRVLYNSKLQNYDIRALPLPKYNTGVWWKT